MRVREKDIQLGKLEIRLTWDWRSCGVPFYFYVLDRDCMGFQVLFFSVDVDRWVNPDTVDQQWEGTPR
jgi:hypothetical protein